MRKAVSVFIFSLFLTASAAAQARVENHLTGEAVVSPDSLALVTGVHFTDRSVQFRPGIRSPRGLAGVEIWFGDSPAQIVTLDERIALICVPRLRLRTGPDVTVQIWTPFEYATTQARVIQATPELYADASGQALGWYRVGLGIPYWINGQPVPVLGGSQQTVVQLMANGLRYARDLVVLVNGQPIVPIYAGAFYVLPGQDCVAFTLPKIEGAVEIQLFWNGRLSRTVQLQVQAGPI